MRRRHLQSACHCRAADQRGQECDQVVTSVMPTVPPQCLPTSASCAGIIFLQLPTHARLARCGGTLVADDIAGQAHQDRGEDCAPWALRHLPDGRGRHPSSSVRRYPAPNRPAQTERGTGLTGGIPLCTLTIGTGASGKRPTGRFRPPPPPIGPSSHVGSAR